jgi:hypothetical protein
LRGIQPEQRAVRRGGVKRGSGAGRVEAALVRYCRPERGGNNTAGNLEAGDDASQEMFAARTALLRERQRRGEDERLVVD